MAKRVEYVMRLGEHDRYRHQHIREGARILGFRVQLETMIGGQWHPVVRYDTAHGFAHRDQFNLEGKASKTPLFIHDYNDALTFAESDLKANWEIYRARFIGG